MARTINFHCRTHICSIPNYDAINWVADTQRLVELNTSDTRFGPSGFNTNIGTDSTTYKSLSASDGVDFFRTCEKFAGDPYLYPIRHSAPDTYFLGHWTDAGYTTNNLTTFKNEVCNYVFLKYGFSLDLMYYATTIGVNIYFYFITILDHVMPNAFFYPIIFIGNDPSSEEIITIS